MLTLKEQTMLGNVPSDWHVEPLWKLITEHYAGDWGEERGANMVKTLRSTNLTNNGRLDLTDVAERSLKPDKAKLLTPLKHDILLERSGGGPDQPVGRVAFINSFMPGYAFSNFLHLLRPDSSRIHPRFLGWVLHRVNKTGRILRLEQQTTQMRNLNFKDYLTMPLPVPSEPQEQEAIARVLDAVDSAIGRTREAIERARALHSSLIADVFDRMEGTREKLGEYITDIRYGTSQASNERGWGNPTLRIPNVVGDDISFDDIVYVDARPSDVARFNLNDDDLLIVRTNGNPYYVGRSAVFRAPDQREWMFASYLIRVRLIDELSPDYVNIYLGTEYGRRELLRRVTTSAGNHNINANSIRLISIPVPKAENDQTRVIEITSTSRGYINELREKVGALEQLKKALMHDLLTGKVRVNNIQLNTIPMEG